MAALANPAAARIDGREELKPTPKVFAELEEARIEQAILKAFGQPDADPKTKPPQAPARIASAGVAGPDMATAT
ncbi:hypothetical protein, partial [Staphylococcus aureus]